MERESQGGGCGGRRACNVQKWETNTNVVCETDSTAKIWDILVKKI